MLDLLVRIVRLKNVRLSVSMGFVKRGFVYVSMDGRVRVAMPRIVRFRV